MVKWTNLLIVALLLAACTTEDPPFPTIAPTWAAEPTAIPAATHIPTATRTTAAASPGIELDQALAGKFNGAAVTIAGPFVDGDQVRFESSIKNFGARTGIDIQYSGSKNFEAAIANRAAGGGLPDIIDFSQPSLLRELAAAGQVVDLSRFISMDFLKSNYRQSWLDMATLKAPTGPITAGIWNRVNSKSLVWYPKARFEKAGYQVPTTWDELLALAEQIKQDGGTPWCVGMEADAATGWVATDWLEDILLRTTSLENYDRWVAGELKFSSPEFINAVTYLTEIWFGSGSVYGGREAIATTSFIAAPRQMFADSSPCWLHRQASFITLFFPKDARPGQDYDFFPLPPIDARFGRPVLVSGDIYAMFNDRPEVRAVMEWFATADSVEGWVRAGGAVSPHLDSRLEWYPNEIDRKIAEIILEADFVRFDGSDQMPAAVGAGAFWKQMTAYVTGSIELPAALKAIDDSWPQK